MSPATRVFDAITQDLSEPPLAPLPLFRPHCVALANDPPLTETSHCQE